MKHYRRNKDPRSQILSDAMSHVLASTSEGGKQKKNFFPIKYDRVSPT